MKIKYLYHISTHFMNRSARSQTGRATRRGKEFVAVTAAAFTVENQVDGMECISEEIKIMMMMMGVSIILIVNFLTNFMRFWVRCFLSKTAKQTKSITFSARKA